MDSHDVQWIRKKLQGVYQIDLNVSYSELGSLFHPALDTAVGDLTEKVRIAYGSIFSSLSTNGTTASNALMLGAILHSGREVILSRGSHSSVYGALVMFDAVPRYVPTKIDPTWGIPVGPSVQDVMRVMDRAPEADVVVLTIPNYFGIVAPVHNLVDEIHDRRKIVVIDAAHGGHFRASHALPKPIEAFRPDIMTHSIHKVSGALSQASLLHAYSEDPDIKARFFEVLNTVPVISTSFSVPILLSIEVALNDLDDQYRWDRAVELATELRRRLDQIDGCQVVRLTCPQMDVADQDITRICVDVSHTGINGYEFAHLLYSDQGGTQGKAFRQLAEMATQRHVVFILTSAATEESIRRLAGAFERIVRKHGHPGHQVSVPQSPDQLPSMVLTPRQAFDTRPNQRKRMPIAEAARCGGVSAETVATYPPGAPIFVAGELLRPEDVEYIRQARSSGATLKGASDPEFQSIEVINV